MKIWVSILALTVALLFGGCVGTVTPDHIDDKTAAPDSSTPKQYAESNNGYLGYRTDAAGNRVAVITPNKKVELANLVEDYRIQFKAIYKVDLNVGDGISPFTDTYRNSLWAVRKGDLKHYGILERWKRDHRSSDSLLQKIVGK